MGQNKNFSGFPKECIKFFKDLSKNNNKAWFDEHKPEYEKFVLSPARDFVFHMGERLKEIAPGIVADPRVNKSIFRIYRDTRFSKDKTPYKDHLGIFFWQGALPKMECSGFYFHLQASGLMLGVGIHCFSKSLIKVYRDSVVDAKMGPSLVKAVNEVSKNGYEIGGERYKRIPRGYDPNHKNAQYLLHDGLWASWSSAPPKELGSEKIVDLCFDKFKDMAPLHKWLKKMTDTVEVS